MNISKYPFIRENKSFMSVTANVLFTQVSKRVQMSAKASVKRFGDRALAAMMSGSKDITMKEKKERWRL